MRILHITWNGEDRFTGTYLQDIFTGTAIDAWNEKNVHHAILSMAPLITPLKEEIQKHNILLKELDMQSPWNLFKAYGIYSFINDYQPDIIHAHSDAFSFLMQIPGFKKTKIILSYPEEREKASNQFTDFLLHALCDYFKTIIFPSETALNHFSRQRSAEIKSHLVTLTPPLSLQISKQLEQKNAVEYKFQTGYQKIIGIILNDDSSKEIDALTTIVNVLIPRLIKKHQDLQFNILFQQKAADQLQKITRDSFPSHTAFFQYRTTNELFASLKALDVALIVDNDVWYSSPIVLLETLGIPYVVYKMNGDASVPLSTNDIYEAEDKLDVFLKHPETTFDVQYQQNLIEQLSIKDHINKLYSLYTVNE